MRNSINSSASAVDFHSQVKPLLAKCCVLLFASSFFLPSAHAEERKVLNPEDLPSYVRKIQNYGERVDFNFDATKVIYVTKPRGEVEELDLKTGKVAKLTAGLSRKKDLGFFRCNYLRDGRILVTGGLSRRECSMFFLSKDRQRLTKLNEPCWEGPAVSRTSSKIAWTPNHIVIYQADLVFENGKPLLKNKEEVLTTSDSAPFIPEYQGRKTAPGKSLKTFVEPQNFVPGQEELLTYSHYGMDPYTAETMVINTKTKAITHLTADKGKKHFDAEPEGAFPTGGYTCIESTFLNAKGQDGQEILRIKVDGFGAPVRLTHFSTIWHRFKATNPVISDDGKWMAFQYGIMWDSVAGAGYGLFVMDLEKAYAALGIEN